MGGWGMEEGVSPPAENLFMPPTPRKILPQVDSPHHQQIFIPPKVDSPPCQTKYFPTGGMGGWGD